MVTRTSMAASSAKSASWKWQTGLAARGSVRMWPSLSAMTIRWSRKSKSMDSVRSAYGMGDVVRPRVVT